MVLIIGDPLDNFVPGTPLDDVILGQGGSDTLIGGGGDDVLASNTTGLVDSLGDILIGDVGNDILLGDDGNDTLLGDDGNDTLLGDDGNDILLGGSGNDILIGGIGDNRIEGGQGQDFIDLTPGDLFNQDTVVFNGPNEGIDVIDGFDVDGSITGPEEDVFEVSAAGFIAAPGANPLVPGRPAPVVFDSNSFGGPNAGFRILTTGSSSASLAFDNNGDIGGIGGTVIVAQLTNVNELTGFSSDNFQVVL